MRLIFNKAMKILVFTTLYPNSVQANHGIFVEKRLLELLKRFDIDARVVAPVPWYPRWLANRRNLPNYHEIPEVETRNGIEVTHPRYPVIPGISWRFAPTVLFHFCKSSVERIRQTFYFDLIDAHFVFPDGVAGARIAKKIGVPCFLTARGSDINESPRYVLPRQYIKRTIRNVSHFVAVSNRLKHRLIGLGADSARISVLPNGVDTEIFSPDQSGSNLSGYETYKPYLLSVGSLRELKGHHLVIEALATTPGLENYALLIAGEGEWRNALQRLIEKFSLQNRVRLIGDIENSALPSLYSEAEAFILASRNEGCPNVLLEALACGTPVVASDVGAVPDLLPDELRTFMIKNREPALIGKSILACLAAGVSREMIRTYAKTLNWEATTASLYHLMTQYIGEKNGGGGER